MTVHRDWLIFAMALRPESRRARRSDGDSRRADGSEHGDRVRRSRSRGELLDRRRHRPARARTAAERSRRGAQGAGAAGVAAPHLIYQRLTKDVEVSPKWPLAFETGTWEGHHGTIAGPVVIGGRYSAQWVKRGERWLIRSEVFVALTCSGVGCEAVRGSVDRSVSGFSHPKPPSFDSPILIIHISRASPVGHRHAHHILTAPMKYPTTVRADVDRGALCLQRCAIAELFEPRATAS